MALAFHWPVGSFYYDRYSTPQHLWRQRKQWSICRVWRLWRQWSIGNPHTLTMHSPLYSDLNLVAKSVSPRDPVYFLFVHMYCISFTFCSLRKARQHTQLTRFFDRNTRHAISLSCYFSQNRATDTHWCHNVWPNTRQRIPFTFCSLHKSRHRATLTHFFRPTYPSSYIVWFLFFPKCAST